VVAVTIDKTTGKLPYEGDTDTIEEVFLQGTEPTETAEPKAFDAGADAEAGTE
jgi:penicillin-binding protein 1A